MHKEQELFDIWVNSQIELFDKMELFDTYLESQEHFLSSWLDSVKSLYESFMTAPQSNEIPDMDKFIPFFKTWFDSSSALSDEIFQKQKVLGDTIEKQASILREMVEKASDSL